MSKQLLILPDSKKFTAKQMAEISEAGFVVVYLPDPTAARIIAPEPMPFTANEMLRAALYAIRREDSYGAYRVFLDGLIAICNAQGKGANDV